MVETETEVGEPRERNKASVFDSSTQSEKTVPHCDVMFQRRQNAVAPRITCRT